jgi:hypothetical protein
VKALALILALAAVSCGAPLMKLPSGPGGPAADAAAVVAQATSACRAVNTFTAEVAVAGSVEHRRLRGRISAGFAAPAAVRLEALAPFGQPVFVLVADATDASVLLPRDRRVLEHGRPDAVLEAIAGVPRGAAELRLTLTGCAPDEIRLPTARALGDDWRMVDAGQDTVYLRREQASRTWRLVAAARNLEHGGRRWIAEYRDFQNGLPRSIRIVSADSPAGPRYDLRLSLSQLEVNVALGPDVFRLQQAETATPISLEELRRAGPLGEK